MSIVLLILKILGIILLVVLGLCFLLGLSLLIIPFRYRIRGKLEETRNIKEFMDSLDNLELRFDGTWLLHLISFRFDIKDLKPQVRLRIFGIQKKFRTKEDTSERKKQKKRSPKKKRQKSEQREQIPKDREQIPGSGEQIPGRSEDISINNIGKPESSSAKDPGPESKLSKWKQKLIHIFQKIKSMPKMIYGKLKDIKGFLSQLVGFYNIKNIIMDETNINVLIFLVKEFRFLMRHLSPKKVKTELTFGTGEPALTGQILGICSVLPFIYRYNCNIQPDFQAETFYIEGTLDIKGHAHGLHLLVLGIRILRNKDMKLLIENYRT